MQSYAPPSRRYVLRIKASRLKTVPLSSLYRRRIPSVSLRRKVTLRKYKKIKSHPLTDIKPFAAAECADTELEANPDGSYVPSAYKLPSGQLSKIRRSGSIRPEDLFEDTEGRTEWRNEPNGYLVKILSARVYDVAISSPLEYAPILSDNLGNTIKLKREDFQPVFSFKLRGAYNMMSHLSRDQLDKGIICSSAGNHAQGVALSAGQLKCDAMICMPTSTPSIKTDAVKRLGSPAHLVGDTYQETQEFAINHGKETGKIYVHPFDDPYTIAGQGTVGKEILDTIQPGNDLDAIFVSIGGGGLISGIAAYVKAIRPHVKIIGVEPAGANAMAISLHQGYRIRLSQVDTFADGVAVKQVGKETFRLCRDLIDGVVMVNNSECSAAIQDVFEETRKILEPAGALALAGAKAYLNHYSIKGATVVAVCSGANVNFKNLRLISDLADVGAKKEFILASTLPEQAGEFKAFVRTALDGTQFDVTEFRYRYAAGSDANIMWAVETEAGSEDEVEELIDRLNSSGYPTLNISETEEVQNMLSNFVGGRPRSYTGAVPSEHIFKIIFPEKQGALLGFLEVVSPRWNVTMFYYRDIGTEAITVLLGIQMLENEEEEFQQAVSSLNGFELQDISDMGSKLYEMFLQ